ncbi:MAG TPA: galactose oxidase-like domain-containing protein [Candidatus Angelobacter sp.]
MRLWLVLPLLFVTLFCLGRQGAAQAQEKLLVKESLSNEPLTPHIQTQEMMHKDAPPSFVEASPQVNGAWETLSVMMPFNPVHMALMYTGKVLVISGSGNDGANNIFEAGVWNPVSQTISTFRLDWDMFCNGMTILPDGKPLVLGGTLKYDVAAPAGAFWGSKNTALFDPATEKFTNGPDMSGGRWYPTATLLGNGSVMVLAGEAAKGGTNIKVEIGDGKRWTTVGIAFGAIQYYPREHLLPDGKVFEDGPNADSQMFDLVTHRWTFVAKTNFGQLRTYGSSVLLPLTPAGGYKPKVMILGGGNEFPPGAATNTTELIDLSVPAPKWVTGPAMVAARIQMNATMLPTGKVLVSGGSAANEDPQTAVLQAELYDPTTNAFTSASTMHFARLYHSNTLLLPDATVIAVGSNPVRGRATFEPHIEVYKPAYLFDSTGNPAKRPVIASLSSSRIKYGTTFQINTPDAASIRSVVLVRPGSVTHAFDMDQRLVGLAFTVKPGQLQATVPSNSNLAPPGYYLLFLVNAEGVPSVAPFVHLGI